MTAPLGWSLEAPALIAAWVRAEGVSVRDADEALRGLVADAAARRTPDGIDEATKVAVRDMLRGRGYKPAGRGKPASEFLASAATKGALPEINNVVDVNNLMSLETGWPMSVFDLDSARAGGADLELRYGREGESFVFNAAGQSIDIGGLVVVARVGGEAIGNPVKDSMETKITGSTRDVLAVLYAPGALTGREGAERAARRYADLLARHAGATGTSVGVLDGAAGS